jgi:signal transduction histidine kinase
LDHRRSGDVITSVVVARAFERFHQADSSIARRHAGLGLGLAIARRLVELHGGTIEAASAGRNRGSMFRVLRPLERSPHALAVSSDRPATAAPLPSLAGLRVMVIDDETDAREFVTTLLAGCGAIVTPAASVAEAMDEMKETLPDVVAARGHHAGATVTLSICRCAQGNCLSSIELAPGAESRYGRSKRSSG